ncbi:GerAB/ArcD/ProY family transporter [Dethiothermospora halolimnae]|uniref:GerAB/ArcD/ProY family transporter n=1 Tax=Dethiothermospora halolimnae TaxID=3114390 RepID=UPI003CCBBA45
MIANNNKITNGQLMAIILGNIIGVGVLSLPRALADSLDQNGWVLILVSGFITIIMTIIITRLMLYKPGKTIAEFARDIVTTPIADFFSFLYILYLLFFAAFVVRVFAEVIKMFLLTKTPTEVIIITMLLTIAYIGRRGVEGIGRIAVLMIPIIILPLIIIFFVILPELEFSNLLPVFRFKFADLVKGIPDTFFSFAGFDLLILFMAYSSNPKKAMKYNISAVLVTMAVYLLIFITVISRFGVVETQHLLWPTLSLMGTIDFPGAFIENIQGVIMALWVLVAFTTLTPLIYGLALTASKLFRVKEYNFFVLPIIPIIFILALVPDNLASIYDYITKISYYLGSFIIIVAPIIVFAVSLFKKGKKGSKNG